MDNALDPMAIRGSGGETEQFRPGSCHASSVRRRLKFRIDQAEPVWTGYRSASAVSRRMPGGFRMSVIR